MNPLDALISTGGGGFSGSSSSNTGAATFTTGFNDAGFTVNQGAPPSWLVYAAIAGAGIALFLALRRR